jgi:NAD(P)-dependent dehydrogenase (short-subunit alcohol dehydrogenase family)
MIGVPGYAAVKGAVEVLTVYMAKELGGRGIAVKTVAPGAIEIDFGGGAVRDNPEVNKIFADMTVLGRTGLPDDIGPMIASLLSEDSLPRNVPRVRVRTGFSRTGSGSGERLPAPVVEIPP